MSTRASRRPPVGEPPSTPRLSRHQKSLHDKLSKVDEKRGEEGLKVWGLSRIYLGALSAMDNSTNPDRFAHAAHGFRELMEKLAWSYPSPEVPSPKGNPPGLKALVNELARSWDKTKRNSTNFKNEAWEGDIDKHTAEFLKSVDGFFKTAAILKPSKVQQGKTLLKQTDLLPFPLPERIEKIRLAEWREYDEYFQRVAHHQSVPSEADFFAWVLRFEEFLLARLSPKTRHAKKKIIAIIQEGKGNA